ncbi:uncharacterized protein TNCV_3767761 [Trichonephila clavipes]|nr:uncharacterized protein TNCV_3767761 [Trichonephila clavipes]
MESMPEPYEIGNLIEEIIGYRQINLEVDSDDVQELMDFHNQELTMNELIIMHEQEKDIKELGSNPGEDMGVCKCIVPVRHGDTLNSRRAASPLVRLVEGEEKWEASNQPQSVLPLNWGGIEPNRTVACMMPKATANDRCHLALCHDEFRGPLSDLCRSSGISNNNNALK